MLRVRHPLHVPPPQPLALGGSAHKQPVHPACEALIHFGKQVKRSRGEGGITMGNALWGHGDDHRVAHYVDQCFFFIDEST